MENFNLYKDLLIPLGSAVIGGGVVAFINYWLGIKGKKEFLKEEAKRKAYGDFLNNAKAFANDPNMSPDDAIQKQKNFIKKYYNEIILSAPKEVIDSIDDFFDSVSISYANDREKIKSFSNMITKMREDLGSDNIKNDNLKIYTPTAEAIKKEKSNEK